MFIVSTSPHIKSDVSTSKIMFGVVIALIPAIIAALAFFGMGAVKVIVVSVLSCVIFEYLIQKMLFKQENISIKDGSAIISGLLLAFNLPAIVPLWTVVVGALVTIGVAKMSFGGLGKNPFNPAIVGRLFLMISFPSYMSTWGVPRLLDFSNTDAQTGATTLGVIKEAVANGQSLTDVNLPSYWDLFVGQIGGSLGEVSALALLLGGIYMLIRKIISWHIPVAYLGTVAFISLLLWYYDPTKFADPIVHLISGGVMLGAIFMATDYATSPMYSKGKIVFGIGCGLLTISIRNFGAYPEGVAFSILIMNSFVPLINNYFKPRVFGTKG
ncbi:MAG: RnfABCDGE type electron transport complex subunit D [Alphaproteobacteria bacterium]